MRPETRLPVSRPCASANATTTVSISPLSIAAFSSVVVRLPGMVVPPAQCGPPRCEPTYLYAVVMHERVIGLCGNCNEEVTQKGRRNLPLGDTIVRNAVTTT